MAIHYRIDTPMFPSGSLPPIILMDKDGQGGSGFGVAKLTNGKFKITVDGSRPGFSNGTVYIVGYIK